MKPGRPAELWKAEDRSCFAARTLCVLVLAATACQSEEMREPDKTPPKWGAEQRRGSFTIPKEGGTGSFDGIQLSIPAGALSKATKMEIRRVERTDLPPLTGGMVNVTKGGVGYRFLPSGLRLRKPAQVVLPLEQDSAVAPLWETLGARTFYWDEVRNRWLPLSRPIVDLAGARVVGETRHFTLMVSAVLASPEHAAPTNFNANSIKDIAAVEPTANVDLIEPPEANNKGDARVTFPIRLPRGRGAYSPQVQLTYSSARGNGPIGVGWDLPVSRVEIDTRWGVPRYDGSERYLIDGAQVVPVPVGAHSHCVSGSLIGEFATRVQTFKRILLCAGASGTRSWEVTEKDGTRFEYGADAESRLSSYEPGEENHTSVWFLRRVVDTNGNATDYRYTSDSDHDVANFLGEQFVQKYLSRIEYTSQVEPISQPTLQSSYRADFTWECGTRSDGAITGRSGFKIVTRCLLGSIDVLARDTINPSTWDQVRRYELKYKVGEFSKTLLQKVQVFGAAGSPFYEHSFDYTGPEYVEHARGAGTQAFDATSTWPVIVNDPFPIDRPRRRLDRTFEEGDQLNAGLGLSAKIGVGGLTAGCEVGASFGVSEDSPIPVVLLRDVNGDGIADRIWLRTDGPIVVLLSPLSPPLLFKPDARVALGDDSRTQFTGSPAATSWLGDSLPELGSEDGAGSSMGVDASCSLGPAQVSGGMSFSVRMAGATSLLVDADGDGRLDLLAGGAFYPGLARECRDGFGPVSTTADGMRGTCSDGLPVCLARDALCFGTLVPLLGAPAPSAGRPIASRRTPSYLASSRQRRTRNGERPVSLVTEHTARAPSNLAGPTNGGAAGLSEHGSAANSIDRASVGPSRGPFALLNLGVPSEQRVPYSEGGHASRRAAVAPPLANQVTNHAEENTWGFNTSVRRRFKKEATLQGEFYPLNPVLRWDAAHTGTIRFNARVRRKYEGGTDGVNVHLLSVTDFKQGTGTSLLGTLHLGPDNTRWTSLMPWLGMIPVKFGESLLLVFDTGKDVPVALDGSLLDELEVEVNIAYLTVCRPSVACRRVHPDELRHLGPTGDLQYLFRFPQDFRTSESPREVYWRAMPPLGPAGVVDRGAPIPNRVIGVVDKVSRTLTAVHVRVRCESIASTTAVDHTVCPLGTVLAEHVFAPQEVGRASLSAEIPEPFVPVAPSNIFDRARFLLSRPKAFDPIRLLFEVDGENGWEIAPNAVKWSPHIEMVSIRDVEPMAGGKPDLTVETVAHLPETPLTGDEITFVAVVRNAGGSRAGPSKLAFKIGDDASPQLLDVPALGAGQSHTVLRKKVLGVAGSHVTTATVDIGHAVAESDEGNNEKAETYSVITPQRMLVSNAPLPDLFVESYTHFPVTPTTHDRITFIAVVRNRGAGPAGPSQLGLWVGGETLARKFSVPALGPRQSQTLQTTDILGAARDYLNKAQADLTSAVHETHEDNNGREDLYRVIGGDAYVSKILVQASTTEYPEKPIVYEPPVLYRVHPTRQLVPFQTVEPDEQIEIAATVVNPKQPLIVTVTGDQMEGVASRLEVGPRDLAIGAHASTKRQTITLPKPGTYFIRGYTEASFDPATSLRVKAERERTIVTEYFALVKDHATSPISTRTQDLAWVSSPVVAPGHEEPGCPSATPVIGPFNVATNPVSTNCILYYQQLDHADIGIAVVAGSEAEGIAKRLAPQATFVTIPAGQTFVLPSGETVVSLGGGGVRIRLDSHDFTMQLGELPAFLVRHGLVTATLVKWEAIAGQVQTGGPSSGGISLAMPTETIEGAYPCCPPYTRIGPPFGQVGAGGPGVEIGYYGFTFPLPITFHERDTLPVNLVSADFGAGYRLPKLVGEVVHSFEPYGGGYHGFFYGLFNGKEDLKCIGPLSCAALSGAGGTSHGGIVTHRKGNPNFSPTRLVGNVLLSLQDTTSQLVTVPGGGPSQPDVDTDGDGIYDSVDKCPLDPEDFDGYEDEDGCPESGGDDPDVDGLPNSIDPMPYAPGPGDGVPDPQPSLYERCGNDNTIDLSPDGCEGRLARRFEPLGSAVTGGNDRTGCMTGGDPGAYICGGNINPSERNSTPNPLLASPRNIRESWTAGVSAYLGAGIDLSKFAFIPAGAGVSVDVATGGVYTSREVQDWNGDGVIDLTSPNVMFLGGRDESVVIDTDCQLWFAGHCLLYPGISEALNTTFGFNLSGSGSGGYVLRTDPQGNVVTAQSRATVTFGRGSQASHSTITSNRLDINGDGLPDILFGAGESGATGRTHLYVRLNLGYRLGAAEDLGVLDPLGQPTGNDIAKKLSSWLQERARVGALTESDNLTLSKSTGGGGGIDLGIFGADASVAKTQSATVAQDAVQFADINGDGLLDFVERFPGSNSVLVRLNTGSFPGHGPSAFLTLSNPLQTSPWALPPEVPGFAWIGESVVPQINWFGGTTSLQAAIDAANRSNSTLHELDQIMTDALGPDGVSAGGARMTTWSGSFSVTVFFVKGTVSYSNNEGASYVQLALEDVDGDGLPDRVLRSGNEGSGGLQVQRNRLGGANLLKTVYRPLGGQVDIRYRRSTPSEADPHSSWLLDSTTLGHQTSVPQNLRTTPIVMAYSYEQPYYDRYEKEDYGYQIVTTMRADGRVTRREYENRDYRLEGFLRRERAYDAHGSLLTETENTYAPTLWGTATSTERDGCVHQLLLPAAYLANATSASTNRTPCDVWFPKPTAIVTRFFEGGTNALERRQFLEEYDEWGNVTKLREEYGPDNTDRLAADIGYDLRNQFLDAYIVDRADSVEVRQDSHAGSILRKRNAAYDSHGNLSTHETWADAAGTKVGRFHIAVGATGGVDSITDANGYQIRYSRDRFTGMLPILTSDNLGLQSTAAYDLRFQLATYTRDANQQEQKTDYDEFGRLFQLFAPYELAAGTPSLTASYSQLNGTFPAYAITTNAAVTPGTTNVHSTLRIGRFFDGLAREIQTQADGEVDGVVGRILAGTVEFDTAGRRIRAGDPVFRPGSTIAFEGLSLDPAHTTIWDYDALDRPTRQVSPGRIRTTWSYEIAEHPRRPGVLTRRTTLTDPEQKVKNLHFDSGDRLVAVVELLGGREITTTYDYQPTGELVHLRDALDDERTFEYDLAGRATVISIPETGRTEYGYDGMGNLIASTDQELCNDPPPLLANCAVSEKVLRNYEKDRLMTVDYPVSPDVTYTYGDAAAPGECDGLSNIRGRVCKVVDAGGEARSSYGALGELTRTTRIMQVGNGAADTREFEAGYVYDSFGRLLSMLYPDGDTVTYEYDNGGRVKHVSGQRGSAKQVYVSDVQYDVYGKVSRLAYGNGVVTVNDYEADTRRMHLQTVTNQTVSDPLRAIEYAYDHVGNVLTTTETRAGAGDPWSAMNRTYTYDDLHRLHTFNFQGTRSDGGQLGAQGTYDYDDVGNLLRQQVTETGAANNLSRDWAYQYTDPVKPGLVQAIGPYNLGYDFRGAVATVTLAAATALYQWNEDGRLSESSPGNTQAVTTYQYDAAGTRARKETDLSAQAGAADDATLYPSPYYSVRFMTRASVRGDTRTKEIPLDGQPIALVAGVVDPSSAGGDERSLSYAATSLHFLHADLVGSTVLVTDGSGSASAHYEYLPFGEMISDASSSLDEPVVLAAFNGKEFDVETGLDYFGARYYDSRFGRWLQSDPAAFEVSRVAEPARLNLYAFALDRPLGVSDPDGRQARYEQGTPQSKPLQTPEQLLEKQLYQLEGFMTAPIAIAAVAVAAGPAVSTALGETSAAVSQASLEVGAQTYVRATTYAELLQGTVNVYTYNIAMSRAGAIIAGLSGFAAGVEGELPAVPGSLDVVAKFNEWQDIGSVAGGYYDWISRMRPFSVRTPNPPPGPCSACHGPGGGMPPVIR